MKTCSVVLILLLWLCLSPKAFAHYVEAEEEATMKKVAHKKKAKHDHDANDPWKLLEYALLQPANAANSQVSNYIQGNFRIIKATGLPDHQTGNFPHQFCPNTMYEQDYTWRMPANPQFSQYITPLRMYPFGVALNGIPFDPFANEFWQRNRNSGWQYEAMILGRRLGLDDSNAHVQPDGAYHYHGLPSGLVRKLGQAGRPILVGYAADGFPIYGPWGYAKADDKSSQLTELHSSYRVKRGFRPNGPGGSYDGTFVQDYEYVEGLGDFDECNGRYGITADYPSGTYYYVITSNYPFIPRYFKGSPDQTFMMRGHVDRPPPPFGMGMPPPPRFEPED